MTTRRHHDVDHALAALRGAPVFSAGWERMLAERFRRDAIAQFGSLHICTRASGAVHTTETAPRGMLFLPLRLTGVVAVGAFIAVGVFAAMQYRDDGTGAGRSPLISMSAPVVQSDAELSIAPGSGNALSVFTTIDVPTAPNRIQGVHPGSGSRVRPVTPASGVFTTWGTNVFTEEERVKNTWDGKNVFSS